MIEDQNYKKIRTITEEFFKKIGIESKVEILPIKDSTIPIDVKADDPYALIGQNGETLMDLQHLLKVMFKKNISGVFYVDLDINKYKKKRTEYLRELARSTADEVSLNKKNVALPPMSAYERRVIHLELADRQDVSTQSTGEGPGRKIIIEPRNQ